MSEESTAGELRRVVEPRYRAAFAVVTSLFFSWALAAALNDVLIRQFRKALELTRLEASLVQFAFYIGYFCAALPAGLLIRRLGYKPVMLGGLALYAGGAVLFWPAAAAGSYLTFLVALYLIAIGLAGLETAANPFISLLGAGETAAARLSLAQGCYGVGAIAGGLVGAQLILGGPEHSAEQLGRLDQGALAALRAAETYKVVGPYLAIAALMAVIAMAIAITRFPAISRPARVSRGELWSVLRRSRRLQAAVVAQFFYVAGQVGIWSFFIDYVKDQAPDATERQAALLLTLTLGLLTLGRFAGAPLGRRFRADRMLAVHAAANVALCMVAALATGPIAIVALLLTSFFMSIMYPSIFALGIERLGPAREIGAGLLVMAIVGGAAAPPVIGAIADGAGRVHGAMAVPAACFLAVLVFALAVPKLDRAAR
jgi:MFS transporter, FHS family, L-fucose permease